MSFIMLKENEHEKLHQVINTISAVDGNGLDPNFVIEDVGIMLDSDEILTTIWSGCSNMSLLMHPVWSIQTNETRMNYITTSCVRVQIVQMNCVACQPLVRSIEPNVDVITNMVMTIMPYVRELVYIVTDVDDPMLYVVSEELFENLTEGLYIIKLEDMASYLINY